MIVRRVGGLAALALAMILEMSCGEVYRPVVIPINPTPPNPANFHAVFGISNNVAFNQGTALQIDVSGDTNIGVANMGVNPTHAAAIPNGSRVFVASAGSLYSGDSDLITGFTPAADSTVGIGLGTPTTFTFPNVGNGISSNITAISEAGNVVTATLGAALGTAPVGAVINVSGVTESGYDGSFPITSVTGTTVQYLNSVTGLAASSGGTVHAADHVFLLAGLCSNHRIHRSLRCKLRSRRRAQLQSQQHRFRCVIERCVELDREHHVSSSGRAPRGSRRNAQRPASLRGESGQRHSRGSFSKGSFDAWNNHRWEHSGVGSGAFRQPTPLRAYPRGWKPGPDRHGFEHRFGESDKFGGRSGSEFPFV